jgi:hypothetical protein
MHRMNASPSPTAETITTATSLATNCLEHAGAARDAVERWSGDERLPDVLVLAVSLGRQVAEARSPIESLTELFAGVRERPYVVRDGESFCCAHVAALEVALRYQQAIQDLGLCHLDHPGRRLLQDALVVRHSLIFG